VPVHGHFKFLRQIIDEFLEDALQLPAFCVLVEPQRKLRVADLEGSAFLDLGQHRLWIDAGLQKLRMRILHRAGERRGADAGREGAGQQRALGEIELILHGHTP